MSTKDADSVTALTVNNTPRDLTAEIDSDALVKLRRYVATQGFQFDEWVKDAAAVDLDVYSVGEPIDKDSLLGVPFVIVDWREMSGTFGPYAFVEIVTKDNRHGFLTDGGVGITDQLRTVHMATGRRSGYVAKRGLRRSDYTTEINGKPIDGTTYYLG